MDVLAPSIDLVQIIVITAFSHTTKPNIGAIIQTQPRHYVIIQTRDTVTVTQRSEQDEQGGVYERERPRERPRDRARKRAKVRARERAKVRASERTKGRARERAKVRATENKKVRARYCRL